MSGSQGNSDSQRGLKETNENLLKEISTLKRKLSEAENIVRKCSLCDMRVEERGLRFCVDCGSKDNSLRLDRNGDVIIGSIDTSRLSPVCATCCFEGVHKGHKTSVLQSFKRSSIAVTRLDKFQSTLRKKREADFAAAVAPLRNALKCLEESSADRNRKAKLVGSDEDLELLIGRENERERVLKQTMNDFASSVKEFAQQLQPLKLPQGGYIWQLRETNVLAKYHPQMVLKRSKELNEDAALSTPAVLEAQMITVYPSGNLRIGLVNNSRDKFVRFRVTEKPACCQVDGVPTNMLAPGARLVLRFSTRFCRKRETDGKEDSIAINYCEVNDLKHSPGLDRLLAVPFKWPC